MTIIPVTLFTSGILGLLYVTLTVQVIRQRQKHDVSMGDGGTDAVQIAIRGHGNFAEYVPLALILLGGIEWAGAAHWLCVLLALMLIVGRFAHPFGLMRPPPNAPRLVGVALTLTMIIIASLWAVLDTL